MRKPVFALVRDAISRRLPTRLVLWSLVIGALLGILGIAEPVDHLLRVARNLSRTHAASGRIVFVGIDDATLAQVGAWPLPRQTYAEAIDRLFALGAKRVFVDLDLSSPSNPAEDGALEASLIRHGKRVVLPGAFYLDSSTNARTDRLPLPRFLRHTDLGNINVHYDSTGVIWQLPYAKSVEGRTIPSFAAKLTGVSGVSGRDFPLDFSIRPNSIPSISMSGLLDGSVPRKMIAGRDIVLALHTTQVPDFYFAPGYGRIAGGYFQILGAETLWEGRPIEAGWLLLFGLATVILLGSFTTGRNVRAIAVQLGGVALLLVIPIILDRYLVFVDIMPALMLLAIPIVTLIWREIRVRFRARATTNAISGLLNLNALRLEAVDPERQLVVARVHNYAEAIAMLPSEAEKALIGQIAARLTLGAPVSQLYQGDDGVFAWFTDAEGRALEGHLDALHALFRSPATVAGANVDMVVTFGIDSGRDRSIANRFGSALVAASEAAAEGAKWKEFDAAKLKDAAWKLSLLGQLDAAIDGGDLWVAYQPKLDLANNRIIGAEALVRWTHREKGDISPMEFIVAAEQNNRIEKLTMHVLERAITAAAAINAHGIPFNIAVNLSVRLLEDSALPRAILALLDEHGLSPSLLTLEITETAAMSANHGLDVLRELRGHGIKISIDDYGTGLSTLEYLKKMPASEIKIDKSFIQSMTENASDLLLVNSTIQLAHSLGYIVVAEGVELAVTLARLTEMGCDIAQGYLIGRPMTFQALSRRLMTERRHAA
jgi:EAL domain-containing protein (putative c-di-GMP-specific phosphodiesterase class I)/CHASE2 domain-containing sensor protein